MYLALKYLVAGAAMLGLSLASAPGASALTIAPMKLSMDASAPVELARHGGGGRGGGVQIRRFGGGGQGFSRGGGGGRNFNRGGGGRGYAIGGGGRGRGYARGPSNRGMYSSGNRGRNYANVGGSRGRNYASNQRLNGRRDVRRASAYGGYRDGQYNRNRNGRYDGNYSGRGDRRYDGRHSGRYDGRHGKWNHYDRRHHGNRYKHRHGHYNHYHDGYWYSWPWWLGTGIGIGIGAYYGDYYDEPYYDTTSAHAAWCLARYRSYNIATDTYMGYDGYLHRCVSPYVY
jgi:hypothetical protein